MSSCSLAAFFLGNNTPKGTWKSLPALLIHGPRLLGSRPRPNTAERRVTAGGQTDAAAQNQSMPQSASSKLFVLFWISLLL